MGDSEHRNTAKKKINDHYIAAREVDRTLSLQGIFLGCPMIYTIYLDIFTPQQFTFVCISHGLEPAILTERIAF